MKQAAIYARVSTEQQLDGYSLDAQVELCLRKAKELGFSDEQIIIYKEEGASGEEIERPAMDRLREDVANGLISHIIITHPDRLSRNIGDKLVAMREFETSEVKLVFTDAEFKETAEGKLLFNILSVIAEYELTLIRKRTIRGRLKAVEKDKKIMPMRVAPYGYDKVGFELVINEEEAEFVRKIYNWYIYENLTMREIGERLVLEGAMPKRKESQNWNSSSIMRILTSEIYTGKYYYNRRETKKVRKERTKSGKVKKTYTFRNESDWICVEVPAIIDRKTFEMAQLQRQKNKKISGNLKFQYLLKSLIKCGHCGRTWAATTYTGRTNKETGEKFRYPVYRCPNLNPRKYGDNVEKCPSRTIRADHLDSYIWNEIVELFSYPDDFVEKIKNQSNVHLDEIRKQVNELDSKIKKKEAERKQVKKMFRLNVITEEELVHDINILNKDIQELQDAHEKLSLQLQEQKHSEMSLEQLKLVIEMIREKLKNEAEFSFEDKRYVIEHLIDQILITTIENDEVVITSFGTFDALKQIREQREHINIESRSQYQKIRKHRRRQRRFDLHRHDRSD